MLCLSQPGDLWSSETLLLPIVVKILLGSLFRKRMLKAHYTLFSNEESKCSVLFHLLQLFAFFADFDKEITILLQIHSTRYLSSSSRKFSYKSTLRIYIFHFQAKNLLRATERRFCIDPNFASLRRSAFSRFNRAWQKKQFVANDHCFRFERSFNEKSWS